MVKVYLFLAPTHFDTCAKSSIYLGTYAKVNKIAKGWVPLPLRAWFWIPLVAFMVLTAVGLEIALAYSRKNDGKLHQVGSLFIF
jgi:hypothetical protein